MRALLIAVGVAVTGYLVARPRLFRLGATDEEAAAVLPGDERVRGAHIHGTRAITIDAPPDRVWPWLAQIGYRRAGWYAFDFADNSGIPSAREIIPELQHPEVGQVIGDEGYRIVEFDPPHHLLLELDHPRVEWVVKEGVWPRFGHSTGPSCCGRSAMAAARGSSHGCTISCRSGCTCCTGHSSRSSTSSSSRRCCGQSRDAPKVATPR